MRSINLQLPDPLYDEAAHVAATVGLSLEAFVLDTLRSRVEEDVREDFFTPQILAEIEAAALEAREGRNLTMAQVRENRIAKREAWLANRPA